MKALLLDLDGTLVDTNAAHARSYAEALAAHGYPIPASEVIRHIGKGGDFLLPDLIGEEGVRRDGDAINEAKKKSFERLAREAGFRIYDSAEALLDAARARGLKLALCTAADEDELDVIFEGAGKDLRPRFDVVTTSSDVDEPKPEPDVLHVAMKKLGVEADACALVGDTVYDGETAGKAGVAFVGVLTGVWSEEELRRAGARLVYTDAAVLERGLDEALERLGRATAVTK